MRRTASEKIGESDSDLNGYREARDEDISGHDDEEGCDNDSRHQTRVGCLPLGILKKFIGSDNSSDELTFIGRQSKAESAIIVECLSAERIK